MVFMDQVVDPQNFGSIVRSSYYLGADCLLVNRDNKPPLSPSVSKISSGAIEKVHVFSVKHVKKFIQEAINNDYKIISTILNKTETLKTVNVNELQKKELLKKGDNCLLILGSEESGVSEIISSEFEKLSKNIINVKVPSYITNPSTKELIDSINVGVSAGILIKKINDIIK